MKKVRAMSGRAAFLMCLALPALLSACGGGGGASAPALRTPVSAPQTAPSATPAPGTVAIPYASNLVAGAQYVGPASFLTRSVTIEMAPADPTAIEAYAQAVNNPASPVYRQFLTPQQIGDRFGASSSSYSATLQYFHSRGMAATGWPQRLEILVTGTQSQLESALGAKFGVYQQGGTAFVALASAPRLPATLNVSGIGRAVDTEPQYAPVLPNPVGGSTDLSQSLAPQQLQRVFDFTGAYASGYTGNGINVAVIATGNTAPQDITTLGSYYHVNVAPLNYAPVVDPSVAPTVCITPGSTPIPALTPAPGPTTPTAYCGSLGLQTPPPVSPKSYVSSSCSTSGGGPVPTFSVTPPCIPDNGEAEIDTQAIAMLAPGSNLMFYLSYNPTFCAAVGSYATKCPDGSAPKPQFADEDAELQQAIADNKADVISMSFGGCEQTLSGTGAMPDNYQRYAISALAAEGVALFAAVGDNAVVSGFCGTYTRSLLYPATDPNVVAVGASYLPVDGAGDLIGQIVPWGFQDTNGYYGNNSGGSDGGYSAVFPEPASQNVIPPPINAGATGPRMVPDVMMAGDPKSAEPIVSYAGLGGPFAGSGNGTSEGAPEAAAEWTLVLQACKQNPGVGSCRPAGSGAYWRLGDPKPYYYGIYSGKGKGGMTYAGVFYDITYGNNTSNPGYPTPLPSGAPQYVYGYTAGPGYDLASGLGIAFARELIKGVVGM